MNKFAIINLKNMVSINFLSKNKQYFKNTLNYCKKIAEQPNLVNFFPIILKKKFNII